VGKKACARTIENGSGCKCVSAGSDFAAPSATILPAVPIAVQPALNVGPSVMSGEAIVPVNSHSVEQLVDMVSSSPCPPLLHRCPDSLEVRCGVLLRDALFAHEKAESLAKKFPTEVNQNNAVLAAKFLWALTPALLRKPPIDATRGDNEGTLHTSLTVKQYVRERLQLAELGRWQELFAAFQGDLISHHASLQRDFLASSLQEPPSDEMIFEKVAQKSKHNNLHAGKQILCGQLTASLTEATALRVDALVSTEIPEGELDEQMRIFHDIRRK